VTIYNVVDDRGADYGIPEECKPAESYSYDATTQTLTKKNEVRKEKARFAGQGELLHAYLSP
jgi:hypothetical protein